MKAEKIHIIEAVKRLWKHAMEQSKKYQDALTGQAFAERAYCYYVVSLLLQAETYEELCKLVSDENGEKVEL